MKNDGGKSAIKKRLNKKALELRKTRDEHEKQIKQLIAPYEERIRDINVQLSDIFEEAKQAGIVDADLCAHEDVSRTTGGAHICNRCDETIRYD
jgi:hypothetical protein